MKNKNRIFFGSLYDVFRFLLLLILVLVLIMIALFSVKFNIKRYDVVFTSRIKTGTYYGVKYGDKFEIWKIEKSENGSLYTERIYPKNEKTEQQ